MVLGHAEGRTWQAGASSTQSSKGKACSDGIAVAKVRQIDPQAWAGSSYPIKDVIGYDWHVMGDMVDQSIRLV
jgi:hypothetical protein